jgi:hypothetical protein
MSTEFDYSKLRGRIIEKYGSQKNFISVIPLGEPAFVQKMKGRVAFKNNEIMLMAEKLDIDKTEIPDYFFCLKN